MNKKDIIDSLKTLPKEELVICCKASDIYCKLYDKEDREEEEKIYNICNKYYKKNKKLLTPPKCPVAVYGATVKLTGLNKKPIDFNPHFDSWETDQIEKQIRKTEEWKEYVKNVKVFFKNIPKEITKDDMAQYLYDAGILQNL